MRKTSFSLLSKKVNTTTHIESICSYLRWKIAICCCCYFTFLHSHRLSPTVVFSFPKVIYKLWLKSQKQRGLTSTALHLNGLWCCLVAALTPSLSSSQLHCCCCFSSSQTALTNDDNFRCLMSAWWRLVTTAKWVRLSKSKIAEYDRVDDLLRRKRAAVCATGESQKKSWLQGNIKKVKRASERELRETFNRAFVHIFCR